MSQFEYISVAISLVLALGVTRLLEGLPNVVQGKKRYWVHGLWCLIIGINFAMTWWIFWNYRDIDVWNLGKFLAVLLYPALSYVVAATLMPSNASVDTDWREYFYQTKYTLFGVLAFAMTAQGVVVVMITSTPVFDPITYMIVGFVGLYLIGFLSSNPKVQAIIVLLHAAMLFLVLMPMAYTPFKIS